MTLSSENITVLIGSIPVLVAAFGYALKKRADAKVARDKAQAELVSARAAEQRARADVLRLEAEARKTSEENTGKFITALGRDREQIDELVAELRRQLRETEAELAEAREKVAGLMKTIDGLMREIEVLRKSINSGAYPAS